MDMFIVYWNCSTINERSPRIIAKWHSGNCSRYLRSCYSLCLYINRCNGVSCFYFNFLYPTLWTSNQGSQVKIWCWLFIIPGWFCIIIIYHHYLQFAKLLANIPHYKNIISLYIITDRRVNTFKFLEEVLSTTPQICSLVYQLLLCFLWIA